MNEQSAPVLNEDKAKQFAEKMFGVINGGALALMMSVGHRTGLFDAMAKLPPATSPEIAEKASLQERYVREWLGAMVASGVVDYQQDGGTYALPPEHAAFLTRAATPDNVAATAQWIAVLGQVEDEIVECFGKGGGVHYSAYARFHKVMAEESDQITGVALLDHILPLVEGLTDALHGGVDVLDVGCGSGRTLNRMAVAFPSSRFTGYDFSEEATAAGRAEAERQGLKNV